MGADAEAVRVGNSYSLAEVLHFNRICDCLENGFGPGEQKRLMSDPLAKSVVRKFRSSREAGREALAGNPRRRAKHRFKFELTDKARAELAELSEPLEAADAK
jgi:hypothetical protein